MVVVAHEQPAQVQDILLFAAAVEHGLAVGAKPWVAVLIESGHKPKLADGKDEVGQRVLQRVNPLQQFCCCGEFCELFTRTGSALLRYAPLLIIAVTCKRVE